MTALPYTPRTITTSTSLVHLEYDPANLPPVFPGWTRFVCISDTHARNFDVPDGDVLLHSGDLTNLGKLSEFQKTMEWLYTLPHKLKIVIAGNHDLTLHTDWYEDAYKQWHGKIKEDVAPILELLTGPRAQKANLVYLKDSSHTFKTRPDGRTWSVYGSPWSPYFFGWAFNYHREEGEALIAKFPKTDILLTHGPPSGIFDQTRNGELAGCEALRARLPALRPRVHLFGHIHEARGACVHAWEGEGAEEAPVVQNEYAGEDEDEDLDLDLEEEKAEDKAHEEKAETEAAANVEVVRQATDTVERTAFVNAAAWPAGRGSWRGTHRVPFGGPGFQPVVVDLRD